ncbi:hypothetical protein G3I60_09515 [Streptomyces sp. SID13666]|uniref:hypothetical protein n=1 Tax=Streptomyces TaxID=1883 RepID=UPI0013C08801|nr:MULTISPECIES: hypothetical protein [Streptomyces]MCZ4095748.1 hypothetical protein [Streptomyces sp. H39-C1]NEA54385.1 hypothetical protein [Streptomyces sp. SID13666]NEA72240.1 hypothetical protein [Streptomyces sp. SID13588]QNA73795.1 hypothetical protein C8250_019395 [Streptomyces sp. So13.3]
MTHREIVEQGVRVLGVAVVCLCSLVGLTAVSLMGLSAGNECDPGDHALCNGWGRDVLSLGPMVVALAAAAVGSYGAMSRRPWRPVLWVIAMAAQFTVWALVMELYG